MPVLIGFTALGTEAGLWYLGKRNLQTAADVAAVSAAFEILAGSGDEVSSAGQEAERHGFDAAGGAIQVNNPPATGTAAGDEDAVEVVLTQPRSLLFAGLFLGGPVDITVRAVARMNATSTACVLALDPAAYRALDVVGTANLQMPGCVLAANSSNPEAISIRGNATVQALTLSTSGDYDVSGSGTLVTQTPPRTGANPLGNPYADRALPPMGLVTRPAINGPARPRSPFRPASTATAWISARSRSWTSRRGLTSSTRVSSTSMAAPRSRVPDARARPA
jgi:hypothetical protein